jgi:hypothetical protein
METMINGARAINPKLAFVPCLYHGHVTPQMAAKYRPFMDGVLLSRTATRPPTAFCL